MKRSVLIAVMLVVCPISLLAQGAAKAESASGTLKVLVTGLKTDKGEVYISLHNSEAMYSDSDAEPFRKLKLPIKDQKAEAIFENLPFGEYAIKLYHDRNSNGKMDKTLGIPNEDYAFSNNAIGAFGPAKYENAKFELKHAEMTMEIRIPTSE